MEKYWVIFFIIVLIQQTACQGVNEINRSNKFLFIQQEQATDQTQQQVIQPQIPNNNPQQVGTNGEAQATNQPAGEENLLLKIPFTKEQFEREMKIQSDNLKKESKRYYEFHLQQLKNITIENKRIIDEKKELIKLYMNHTTFYLDNLANVLQRELEQNHDIMLNLAQAIILQILENYDLKIAKIKIQMQEIMIKIQPPTTICEKYMECQSCVVQQDCIWSPDRRACFTGSKYDGCYFDYCEYFIKENCVSNAKGDREEQNQLEHFSNDEELAVIMDQVYDKEYTELAAQRIPQPQKNYIIIQQNKLINLKNLIQRVRIYINYTKKIYFKLRYQNIIFKRKRQKQKEEDLQFLKDLENSDEEFLKHIHENESDKALTLDDILKNDKAISDYDEKQNQKNEQTKNQESKIIEISQDGSIILPNGEKLEGLRVIDGKIISEFTGEERTDLKFVNGKIIGEDGKALSSNDLKEILAEEDSFFDDLLVSWFGDEYQPQNTDLSDKDENILEQEKDHTVIDIDADQVENEEQTILEYVADQVEKQKLLESENDDDD